MNATLFSIAVGGAVGALCRYGISNLLYDAFGRGFPHGTLLVNLSGCFLMGVLATILAQRGAPMALRAGILVGFLGAYTTFSTFSLETLKHFEQDQYLRAGLNMVLSAVGSVMAVGLGVVWVRVMPDTWSAKTCWPAAMISLVLSGIPVLAGLGVRIALTRSGVAEPTSYMIIAGLILVLAGFLAMAAFLALPKAESYLSVIGLVVCELFLVSFALALGYRLSESYLLRRTID